MYTVFDNIHNILLLHGHGRLYTRIMNAIKYRQAPMFVCVHIHNMCIHIHTMCIQAPMFVCIHMYNICIHMHIISVDRRQCSYVYTYIVYVYTCIIYVYTCIIYVYTCI